MQLCGHNSDWCHVLCFLSLFKFLTARKDFHRGARLEYKALSYKKQFMWGHNLSLSTAYISGMCSLEISQSWVWTLNQECWKSNNKKHSLRDALLAAVFSLIGRTTTLHLPLWIQYRLQTLNTEVQINPQELCQFCCR